MNRATQITTEARYHVPRSQVWEGSRGRQQGCVHLHVNEPMQQGRLQRGGGQALCGKAGWYERPANPDERACPRCLELAARYGVRVPLGVGRRADT